MEFIYDLENNEICRNFTGAYDSNLAILEDKLEVRIIPFATRLTVEYKNNKDGLLKILDKIKAISKVHYVTKEDIEQSILDESFTENKVILLPNSCVKAKSQGQVQLINAFENIDIIFVEGSSGTGKTFLSISYALSKLLSKEIKKIVLIRNAIESNETLGFLPGNLNEKLLPFMVAFYDSFEKLAKKEVIEKLFENKKIEMQSFSYLRGRTFDDSIIIIDESQNTRESDMLLALSRVGHNSQIIVCADLQQKDKRHFNGFELSRKYLASLKETAIINLTDCDIIRSDLALKIVQAFNKNGGCGDIT